VRASFRLGDLAAGGDLALDDGRLDAPEDVFGHVSESSCASLGFELIQHIVDTLKSNAAKTSQSGPVSQRINQYCRQSSNNLPTGLNGGLPALAPKTIVLECRPHLPDIAR
jgi:hypothetical protein